MNQEKPSPWSGPESFSLALTCEDIKSLMEIPSSAVALALRSGLLKDGAVLDVGCGSGRNSLLLARNGFSVTAVDNNPQKIEELTGAASESGLDSHISAEQAELTTLDFTEIYDNMVAVYCLRFLPKEEFLPTMDRLMAATAPGGLHIVQDLTRNGPLYNTSTSGHWLATDELRLIYEAVGWEVLTYTEEYVPTAEMNPQGRPYMHQAATIVARKMV